MILRRVISHVRKQEWTAIWIDLAIVVVGVFIGIQVSNWNQDRATAQRGAVFAERLRSDLCVEAWGYEMLVGYYGDVAAHGRRTLDALAGHAPMSDEALLIAPYRATQYSATIRRRATFDELVSRGELSLITDPALRDLAQTVYTTPFIGYIFEEGRASAYRHWFRLNMPHNVQRALAKACGDCHLNFGNDAGIDGVIDYPCTTGLRDHTIAAAVALLRDDPEAIRLLRLRVADIDTSVNDLAFNFADMRDSLRVLAGKSP